MPNRRRFLPYTFLILGAAFVIGWPFIERQIWTPKERQPTPNDLLGFVAGGGAVAAEVDGVRQRTAERNGLGLVAGPMVVAAEDVGSRRLIAAEARAKRLAKEKANQPQAELLAMGRGENPFNLQVLANTLGGRSSR